MPLQSEVCLIECSSVVDGGNWLECLFCIPGPILCAWGRYCVATLSIKIYQCVFKTVIDLDSSDLREANMKFHKLFNMPPEEKVVNCKFSSFPLPVIFFRYFLPRFNCRFEQQQMFGMDSLGCLIVYCVLFPLHLWVRFIRGKRNNCAYFLIYNRKVSWLK